MGVNGNIQNKTIGEGKSHSPGILHGNIIMCRVRRQKGHNNVD
jgi:hypothetical protein